MQTASAVVPRSKYNTAAEMGRLAVAWRRLADILDENGRHVQATEYREIADVADPEIPKDAGQDPADSSEVRHV